MIDSKLSQYLLKVPSSIQNQLSLNPESSKYSRAKFIIYLVKDSIELIVKRMNKIVLYENATKKGEEV